jgi:hypothetical protein
MSGDKVRPIGTDRPNTNMENQLTDWAYDTRTAKDDDALKQLVGSLGTEGWEIVQVIYRRDWDRLALLHAPRDDFVLLIRRPGETSP